MKNIKVRTKLTIILALVIVLVTSESFISIKNMNQLKDKALETMDTSSRQNYDDSIKEQVGVVISLLSEINNEYKSGKLKMSTFNAKVFSCFFTFSNMHISKQLYLCILYNYMFLMGVGVGSGS